MDKKQPISMFVTVVLPAVLVVIIILFFLIPKVKENRVEEQGPKNIETVQNDIYPKDVVFVTERKPDYDDIVNSLVSDYKQIEIDNIFGLDNEVIHEVNVGDYKIVFPDTVSYFNYEWNKDSDPNALEYSVYRNNSFVGTYELFDQLISISKLTYKDTDIILLGMYSGGAHCCRTEQPLILGDELIIGPVLDLTHGGINAVFEKNDALYFMAYDYRFAYFYTCFACSGPMIYPAFYRLDYMDGSIEKVNEEFRDIYLQEADKLAIEVVSAWNSEESKFEPTDDLMYENLVGRAIHSRLAGQGVEVWNDFRRDYAAYREYETDEIDLSFFGDATVEDIIEGAEEYLDLPIEL